MPREVHIAIIDDGVSADELGIHLDYNIEIDRNLGTTVRANDKIGLSHGTLCAAIVLKYNPHVKISSIKILNHHLKGEPAQFYAALHWCVDHNIDVVNVSLGSTYLNEKKQMRETVNQLVEAGLIIVCACHNDGYITYPASLSNVVGVKCHTSQQLSQNDYAFNYYSDEGIDVTASAMHELNLPFFGSMICSNSNSYAAPFITAYISKILYDASSSYIDDVKIQLLQNAKNHNVTGYVLPVSESPDWITGAFIFLKPNALLDYNSLYFPHFKTIFVYEPKAIAAYVREELTSLDKHEFNTIIIDDVLMNEKMFDCIYRIASEYQMNIVYVGESFFDIPTPVQSINIKLWHWSYKRNIIRYNSYTTASLAIPLIAIFTSGQIESFNLLNRLKEYFLGEHYECSAVSCEPAANLFDIEYLPKWSMMHYAEDTAGYLSSYLRRTSSDLCVTTFEIGSRPEIEEFLCFLEADIEVYLYAENELVRIIDHTDEGKEILTTTVKTENFVDIVAGFLFKYLKQQLT
ncbi:S8 family serine peptidase [Paenibacillus kribbensis]|uniref:S8 family serine peptidase n=1 Tax=Paenibacillus kribbensis TaxID=172713 RepID=UPI00083820D0|nr:S8 family serine peptidase [Paenibacillus kribbensis]